MEQQSTDCVHASSVNMFKTRIDQYLVSSGYTGGVRINQGVPWMAVLLKLCNMYIFKCMCIINVCY